MRRCSVLVSPLLVLLIIACGFTPTAAPTAPSVEATVPAVEGSTPSPAETPAVVSPEETPRSPTEPLPPLTGRWIWREDSDGMTPVSGAECALVFFGDGSLDLNCMMPGEELHDHGSYSVSDATANGGTIDLELPTIPIAVQTEPYTITADGLTLPFTLISGSPGTSLWQEQPEPSIDPLDFIAVAYKVYEEALLAGASDDEAAEAAAAALREGEFAQDVWYADSIARFAASNATGLLLHAAQPPQVASLAEVILNAQKTAIYVKKENGRVYHIILKGRMPRRDEFIEHPDEDPIAPGFFAEDPRTHLYMQVSSGPNDPARHTATLLFPMHSLKNFHRGRFYTFKNWGEDPDVLRDQLLRAGYQSADITVKIDDEVSPKTIADELLKNPGIFYISTHGASGRNPDGTPGFLLVTGTKVVPKRGQSRDQALVEAVLGLGLPDYLQETISWYPVAVDREEDRLFLGVGDAFFKALRDNNSDWDMSRSLVYLDACQSTATPSAVNLLRPAALLGWRTSNGVDVSSRYSQHFFRNAVRKTHSVREIWYERHRVLMTRQAIYEEDALLDDPDYVIRKRLVAHDASFEAYGSDGKPYTYPGDGLYPNTETDVVFWLVWLGRWNQDPDTASANLLSCYDQVWSKGRKGLGVSPLCTAGYLGNHVPTAQEVKEARQLINGQPAPIPGGRWTMADSLPYGEEP